MIDRCANIFANLALIWMKVATEVGVNGQRDWVSCATRRKNHKSRLMGAFSPRPVSSRSVAFSAAERKKKILEIVFPPISPGCFWRPPSATDPRGVRLRNRSKNVSLKAEDTREEAEPNRRKFCFFPPSLPRLVFYKYFGWRGRRFRQIGEKEQEKKWWCGENEECHCWRKGETRRVGGLKAIKNVRFVPMSRFTQYSAAAAYLKLSSLPAT